MSWRSTGSWTSQASKRFTAYLNVVSPDYFETLGIPLKRGRGLTEQDREGGLPVAIVNEALVKRCLPNVDPLAQRLAIQRLMPGLKLGPAIEWQIVGVHGDVRTADPKNEGRPEIILPFWQSPWAYMVRYRYSSPKRSDLIWSDLSVPTHWYGQFPGIGNSDYLLGTAFFGNLDLDSLFGFAGRFQDFDFKFLGEKEMLAVVHAKYLPARQCAADCRALPTRRGSLRPTGPIP